VKYLAIAANLSVFEDDGRSFGASMNFWDLKFFEVSLIPFGMVCDIDSGHLNPASKHFYTSDSIAGGSRAPSVV